MQTLTQNFAWDQYPSSSGEESSNNRDKLITEATEQIFLRRYSSFPLDQNELLEVFAISNYDDDIIKQKLDERLYAVQKNKTHKKYSHMNNNMKKTFQYNDNKGKKYKYSNKKKLHNKKTKYNSFKGIKKNYKTELIEIPCEIIQNNMDNSNKEKGKIDLSDLKKNIDELEDDLKTSTSLSRGLDLSSQASNKEISEEKKSEK